MPDCFAPRGQPNGQLPQSSQPVALRRIGASLPAQPFRAADDDGSFGGRRGAGAIDSSASSVAMSSLHASPSAIRRGRGRPPTRRGPRPAPRSQVIQLTSVPPPTPEPASIVTDASQVARRPWLRYSRENASSSSRGIDASSTNGPASRTTTDRPASASSAATTPAAGARADDDHVGLEHDRLVARAVIERERVRPDRRRLAVTRRPSGS